MSRCRRRLPGVFIFCVCVGGFSQTPTAHSRDAVAVLRKARELGLAHQPKAAEVLLRPYLANYPKDVEALTLFAELQLADGDHSGAEQTLTAALAAEPNSIAPNLAMGEVLL